MSTIFASDKRQRLVKMVLYVAGKVEVEQAWACIEQGKSSFVLAWENLGEPDVRAVDRYVAFEKAETCTRLEWVQPVVGPFWEATFSIFRK